MRIKQQSKTSTRENNTDKSKSRTSTALVNLAGILLAFGIALGGIGLVENRLAREKTALLQGSGSVALPEGAESIEAEPLDESENPLIYLTEDELTRAVQDMRNGMEAYPHEPRRLQLTMAQAVEYSSIWLKTFVMPYLGLSSYSSDDFRANCYLWTPREEVYLDADTDPRLSYWTVSLSCRELEAELTLNAASGQILDASIVCASPVEYQNQENLTMLLWDYACSFALEADYSTIISQDGIIEHSSNLYQSVGSQGVFAALQTGSFVVGKADSDADDAEYNEFFTVHLYLTMELPYQTSPF